MNRLVVTGTKVFTSEMELLRRRVFGETLPNLDSYANSVDEFDDKRTHVVLRLGGRLVGLCRFTPGPASVLQTWSRGKAPTPTGKYVYEISRIVIDETVRRRGFYSLLMAETVLRAKRSGAKLIAGGIAPDVPHKRFMMLIGFEDIGNVMDYEPPPYTRMPGQTVKHSLSKRGIQRVQMEHHSIRIRLESQGLTVNTDCETMR